jgi:hypothetical protein
MPDSDREAKPLSKFAEVKFICTDPNRWKPRLAGLLLLPGIVYPEATVAIPTAVASD